MITENKDLMQSYIIKCLSFFNLYLDELEMVSGLVYRLGSLNMHIHTYFYYK